MHDIHNCLLMGWQQTIRACMCITAMVPPQHCGVTIWQWQHVLKRLVNT